MAEPVHQVIIGSTRPGRVGAGNRELVLRTHRPRRDWLAALPRARSADHRHAPVPTHEEVVSDHRSGRRLRLRDTRVPPQFQRRDEERAGPSRQRVAPQRRWLRELRRRRPETRTVEQPKPVLTSLKLVHAGDVTGALSSVPVVDGTFAGNAVPTRSATALLNELALFTPVSRRCASRSPQWSGTSPPCKSVRHEGF